MTKVKQKCDREKKRRMRKGKVDIHVKVTYWKEKIKGVTRLKKKKDG